MAALVPPSVSVGLFFSLSELQVEEGAGSRQGHPSFLTFLLEL